MHRHLSLLAFLFALFCGLACRDARAASPGDVVVRFAAGANGIWFDDSANPSDFEAGAAARASLSPHFSVVGSGYYGFAHSYLRGSAGIRVTATDVDNPDFSIGLGVQRHFSSEPALRPEEWAYDASIGYRPWPETNPKVTLIAQGGYGIDSNQASYLAGVRYTLGDW